ncbi:GNAT family N-acetyltransferase [Propioniciclava tarda]|uniref:GNAT family N-acetyltransferase n=1 Tax=Propioniciclava tarda TaxID=433330 RepID=UPI001169368D|nr:GNAT family N-acetyltransferase [Propioniciclava tarda]SMO72711.1 Acetyltransferase (GNAT) family protein [Propioniciclava tarda]
MTTDFTAPRKLEHSDVRKGFDSGAAELDEWLEKYSWQNQQANNATTYVITDGHRVVGYYAITMAAVAQAGAPAEMQKGRPSQIPCILLARLAVDRSAQGAGFGWELLRDALLRAVALSQSIGAAAVLVHCRDESAKEFYLRNGDFLQSPVEDLHLMVPVKALERYVD